MKPFLILILLLLHNYSINAQSVIERQILAIGLILRLEGYELTHNIRTGYLRTGEVTNYYFNLSSGRNYIIYAVCDEDCGDIDLCLFDENDNEISCDNKTDSMPFVNVTPRWTGSFRLRVRMYNCRVNPCKFGIAVFGN